jgi:hypothetical protein
VFESKPSVGSSSRFFNDERGLGVGFEGYEASTASSAPTDWAFSVVEGHADASEGRSRLSVDDGADDLKGTTRIVSEKVAAAKEEEK